MLLTGVVPFDPVGTVLANQPVVSIIVDAADEVVPVDPLKLVIV